MASCYASFTVEDEDGNLLSSTFVNQKIPIPVKTNPLRPYVVKVHGDFLGCFIACVNEKKWKHHPVKPNR